LSTGLIPETFHGVPLDGAGFHTAVFFQNRGGAAGPEREVRGVPHVFKPVVRRLD